MSTRKAPEIVTLFDPRNASRTRTVRKDLAKRWEKQGWTTTAPKSTDDKPEAQANGSS